MTIQDFLTLALDHQKDDYSLDDSICDFLLYYNETSLNRKVSLSKTMVNARGWELTGNMETPKGD